MANWNPVTVRVWPGQNLETKLPMLIFIAFLLGSLPMWIALRTTRWSLKRRLDTSERQLADMRALANRPFDPAPAPPMPTPAVGVLRPEERRLGKARVSTCTSRRSPDT